MHALELIKIVILLRLDLTAAIVNIFLLDLVILSFQIMPSMLIQLQLTPVSQSDIIQQQCL